MPRGIDSKREVLHSQAAAVCCRGFRGVQGVDWSPLHASLCVHEPQVKMLNDGTDPSNIIYSFIDFKKNPNLNLEICCTGQTEKNKTEKLIIC